MKSGTDTSNLEEDVHDMITRVMTLARLLVMQSVVEGGPGANPARDQRKKHRTENL